MKTCCQSDKMDYSPLRSECNEIYRNQSRVLMGKGEGEILNRYKSRLANGTGDSGQKQLNTKVHE
jgi:hypothetical protein